jgi:DNA invertase Pin-like site-specific DNA recombinase
MEYGYCRISTPKQNIERQVRNIKEEYPNCVIIREVFTGTKFQGRKELEKLLKIIKADDTIVFDSVSRMSRNAEEGFQLYQELYQKSVNLVFLKEPHINTETYKKVAQIDLLGDKVDFILEGVNKYLMELAKEQIRLAFEQAEKEVSDLRQRTKEGLVTAKLNGKKVGRQVGSRIETQKAIKAKELIRQYSRDFDGSLKDNDAIVLINISRNSYYKYKKELLALG